MERMIANFARSLKREERKQLDDYGEIENVEVNLPLLSWSQKPYAKRTEKEKGYIFNTISFTETVKNSLIQTEQDDFVATKEGIVIAITTEAIGQVRLYFFESNEYDKALDFYNKMTEALKNNNNF